MERSIVISIQDLNQYLPSGASVSSELLCEPQVVEVPPIACGTVNRPSYVPGPLIGWGDESYEIPIKELMLHVIEGDIRVKGPFGIITVNGVTIKETLYYVHMGEAKKWLEYFKMGTIETKQDAIYFTPVESEDIVALSQPCYNATGGFAPKRNYGHFWLDHISHFGAWHEFGDKIPKSCCALISGMSNGFWDETLQIMTEAQSHPMTFYPIQLNQEVHLEKLYFLHGASRWYPSKPRPQYFNFTRMLAKRAAQRLTQDQAREINDVGSKVVYSRGQDGTRSSPQADQIWDDVFMRNGYKIINARNLSITQKLAIASRAKVLALRMGSAGVNTFFAPEGVILAELHSPFGVTWSHRQGAACSGLHHYATLVGQAEANCNSAIETPDGWSISRESVQLLVDCIESLTKIP